MCVHVHTCVWVPGCIRARVCEHMAFTVTHQTVLCFVQPQKGALLAFLGPAPPQWLGPAQRVSTWVAST